MVEQGVDEVLVDDQICVESLGSDQPRGQSEEGLVESSEHEGILGVIVEIPGLLLQPLEPASVVRVGPGVGFQALDVVYLGQWITDHLAVAALFAIDDSPLVSVQPLSDLAPGYGGTERNMPHVDVESSEDPFVRFDNLLHLVGDDLLAVLQSQVLLQVPVGYFVYGGHFAPQIERDSIRLLVLECSEYSLPGRHLSSGDSSR